MKADVLGIDPQHYRPHPLHSAERAWSETNCATDFWIEALHAMGHDPVAGLGFVLGTGFDGDQWRMFTYPAEDLQVLYGLEVDELNVWRPLRLHVAEQLGLGNLVALDADAWWLPDTAGLTYRSAHQKTTVLAQMIDTGARRLGYFHNTGYYELEGEDFDALLPAHPAAGSLPPYVLQVRLGRLRPAGPVDDRLARWLAARHLGRRPAGNPVALLADRVAADLGWIRAAGMDTYHRWAFGTLRQCGANAALAADLLGRLDPAGPAAGHFDRVASGMKAAELALARAVRGRPVDVPGLLAPLAEAWVQAVAATGTVLGAADAADGPWLAVPA